MKRELTIVGENRNVDVLQDGGEVGNKSGGCGSPAGKDRTSFRFSIRRWKADWPDRFGERKSVR